jgi:histidinol phosphatase-like enzyme
LLGFDIDYLFCPHNSFPISCYCRKPMPGLGVALVEKYKLDPSQCIMVGDRTTDKTFASRSGFQFQHASKFFA